MAFLRLPVDVRQTKVIHLKRVVGLMILKRKITDLQLEELIQA